MEIKEKINYAIGLMNGVGLYKEKMPDVEKQLLEKSDGELDEILIRLERYYTNQEELDRRFIKGIDKLSANLDEAIDRAVDEQALENLLLD